MTPAEMKAWREGMGLSQAKAAVLLGVHLRTVTAWEIGQHPIPHMARLACQWLAGRPEAPDERREVGLEAALLAGQRAYRQGITLPDLVLPRDPELAAAVAAGWRRLFEADKGGVFGCERDG